MGGQIDPLRKNYPQKALIRVKERPGFPHPYFVLNIHIFQPYCLDISALIFAG